MNPTAYNATVVGKIQITPDIIILRVDTDDPRPEFAAGQYTVLGLYGSEPRSANSEDETVPSPTDKLIRRPYSIASEQSETRQFEFYVSQVKSGQLTPRLFHLQAGDRLHVGTKIVGMFKLAEAPDTNDVVMVATGTGVAPYISFLRSHIIERPKMKMVVVQGATHQWDLGYYSELSFLAKTFPNFYYLPTLTDASETWPGHRLWIEEMLVQEVIQKEASVVVDPGKTHFFLCGNPKMIENVSAWLIQKGYIINKRKTPGSLYVEEF